MDYQNRAGNKGAGVAGASEANVDRRERLRKLALETIDINKVRGAHCDGRQRTQSGSRTWGKMATRARCAVVRRRRRRSAARAQAKAAEGTAWRAASRRAEHRGAAAGLTGCASRQPLARFRLVCCKRGAESASVRSQCLRQCANRS
jgi:hypothetical protein